MELLILIALGIGAAVLYSKSQTNTTPTTPAKPVGSASDIPGIPGGAPTK